MARRSLRPQLNQIRTWVRQGRTDAWIAHQLEVTVQQIVTFKRENELSPDAVEEGADTALDADAEIDLRAEDDARIAAELEAEAARAAEEAANAPEPEEDAEEESEDGDDDKPRSTRRRGRRGRGGAGNRGRGGSLALEGTFDHGEEGFGLWLDPAVEDNAVYAEHWAGHRPVEVTLEADRIVIRRAGAEGDSDDD